MFQRGFSKYDNYWIKILELSEFQQTTKKSLIDKNIFVIFDSQS